MIWAASTLVSSSVTLAQTPSPLQEWQYASGVILQNLFERHVPRWRVILGPSAQWQPVYPGARRYRTEPGPLIDIRYRNILYASVGEGLGADLLRGRHYRAGVSLGYDIGRREGDDQTRLQGLGAIAPAGVAKAYASIVVARKFPLVLRVDVRQFLGGAGGAVADLGAYLPLPGSSDRFVMFAGPSITFSNRHHLQSEFGVTAAQSAASGYRVFRAGGGEEAEGLGFSATAFVTASWLANLSAAYSRLLGSVRDSPIVERRTQEVVTLSVAYYWESRARDPP